MGRRILLLCLTCLALAVMTLLLWPRATKRASGPLPHAAYVWQRVWHDPVLTAILHHHTNFSQICVLAAEITWSQGRPTVVRVPINQEALRLLNCRVGLALRIGPYAGPFASDDEVARRLGDLAAWLVDTATTNGVNIAELQVDFDCAESKLAGYTKWVNAIRQRVNPVPVVITALPAWLKRPAFLELAQRADGFVLQVHSLERPRGFDAPFTLCEPEAARRAVERAARAGRPFRVALPTYGYLTAFDTNGRFLGLSAEGPARTWPEGVRLREVRADPQAMARLIQTWTRDRPELLQGIIWYRLPVPGDRLNWPWPTLAAVMAGRLPAAARTVAVRCPEPGLFEIVLLNTGDAEDSSAVSLQVKWRRARRLASDGVNGFEVLDPLPTILKLYRPAGAGRLNPGQTQVAGWLRLDSDDTVEAEIVTRN